MVTQDEEDVAAANVSPVPSRLLEAEVAEEHESIPSIDRTVDNIQDGFVVLLDRGVLRARVLTEILAAEVQVCRKEGLHHISPSNSVREVLPAALGLPLRSMYSACMSGSKSTMPG